MNTLPDRAKLVAPVLASRRRLLAAFAALGGLADMNAATSVEAQAGSSPATIAVVPYAGPREDGTRSPDFRTLQAAIDSQTADPAKIVIKPGVYEITGSLTLKSGTHIVCEPGAVLKPLTADTVFINANARRDWKTDITPPAEANMSDTDISVSGCTFDFRAARKVLLDGLGPGGIAILLARRVAIFDNRMIGGDVQGQIGNMVRVSKASDVEVARNEGTKLSNGFGFWGGGARIHAHDNVWDIAVNTFNPSPFSCSNINGAGTAYDHQVISDIVYDHNICRIHGGENSFGVVAYNYGSLSSGSKIRNLQFSDNTTIAAGRSNICFSANGDIRDMRMLGNRFENCEGPAITFSAHGVKWGERLRVFTAAAGSQIVALTSDDISPATISVGNFIGFDRLVTVGDLSLRGGLRITSVEKGRLQFEATAPAARSAAREMAVGLATFWGAARDVRVERNTIVNVRAPGDAAIVVEGPGGVVRDNVVSGVYGALTLTSSHDCCSHAPPPPTVLSDNRGAPGSGVTHNVGGFLPMGDKLNVFEPGFPPQRRPH